MTFSLFCIVFIINFKYIQEYCYKIYLFKKIKKKTLLVHVAYPATKPRILRQCFLIAIFVLL